MDRGVRFEGMSGVGRVGQLVERSDARLLSTTAVSGHERVFSMGSDT